MIRILLLSFGIFLEAEAQVPKTPHIRYERNPYYISEGFNLGFILDFQREGIAIRSFEGNMNLGFGTSSGDFPDPDCQKMSQPNPQLHCTMFSNPWRFSTVHRSMYWRYLKIAKASQTPVLIYYVTPLYSTEHIITQTKNFIQGIFPVNKNLAIAPSYALTRAQMPVGLTVNDARGFLDGRIVHASLDHIFRKSFEVIIQEGEFGNNFRRMSVSDQKLFDYIVKAMQTGKVLKIGYVELLEDENDFLRWFKHYDSRYRVVSVEIQQ